MQKDNYCLILFDKKYCIKQSINYIFSLKLSKDNIKILSNIIIYLLILACEEFSKIFNISLVYTKTKDKKIILNNKKNIIDWLNYFLNLYNYYNKNFNLFFQFKYFNYVFNSIFILISKTWVREIFIYIITDENIAILIKWGIITIWTFGVSYIIRRKYKEKNLFYSSNYHKFKNKTINMTPSIYLWWRLYFKYNQTYSTYLSLKKYFILNENNNLYLYFYDLQTQKHWKQMNIFYELLEKDGLIYQKNKVIKKSLYKMFLKENRISIFGGKKKEMSQIIYLISYRNLLQNIDMKNDSNVSIDLHILNKYFKDLDSMNKVYGDDKVDIFHDMLNSPLVVPSKYYRKFEDTQHFTEVFNDIKKFTIKDLAKIIKDAFKLIDNAKVILSSNTNECEIEEYINSNDSSDSNDSKSNINFNDIAVNIHLDSRAAKDLAFIRFLENWNNIYKWSKLYESVLQMNLFDLQNNKVLGDDEVLSTFIDNDFFCLDYFYVVINNEKYTLCYLVSLYKVLENIEKYKAYYDNEYKKYNNNKSIINKVFNSFVNCKFDKFLDNNNNSQFNIDFSSSVKNKDFRNLKYNVKQKDNKHYNYNYKKFVKWFEEYEKNMKNIDTEFKPFSDFIYTDIDISAIKERIEIRRSILLEWLSYYKFEGEHLTNFYDIGFYLYNIKGYEHAYYDTIMFYEYKDCDMLDFFTGDNIDNILQKSEFQYNFNLLFFYYAIALFKKSKFHIFNFTPDQLLFDDLPTVQKDDPIIYKHYVDSVSYLRHLVATFKSLVKVNDNIICSFVTQIDSFIVRFKDYYENIDFNYLYNTDYMKELKYNREGVYDLELKLNHLFEIWKSLMDVIPENRKSLADAINLLRIDNKKIKILLNMDIFKNNKSILLLQDAILTKLEEFIINERKLDNIFNILMCSYRKMEAHNRQLLIECLLKNGYMPQWNYFTIDDWKIVFSLEKQDPLILIKLYNSKQQNVYSEYWNSNIKLNDILEELSCLDEKQLLSKNYDNDWVLFFNKYRNRDLIIYDLTEHHINELSSYLEANNNITFNQLDIIQEITNLTQSNNLKYNIINRVFEKIPKENNRYNKIKISNDDSFYDSLIIQNQQAPENYSLYQKIRNKNKARQVLAEQGIDINIIKEDQETDSFILFDFILDNNKIKLDNQLISYLEPIIKELPNGNFSSFILSLFKKLSSDYDHISNPNELVALTPTANYLFYIVNFYENILKLNSFDISYSKMINTNILESEFDYAFYVKNNNFIDEHMIIFSYNKYNTKIDYNAIVEQLNYKKTYVWLEGKEYLLSVKEIFKDNKYYYLDINPTLDIKVIEHDYLPKLKDNILDCNYSSRLFYNIDGKENSFLFFDEIFNTLNIGILKINNMLNKLMYLKKLINIYLNFCEKDINNLQIIKELYYLLYKDNNNIAYMQLINLLLYIKDPIYLYNILATDIKCYVDFVLDLFNILQNVSSDSNYTCHKDLQGKLMHIFLCDERKLKDKINYMINSDSNLSLLYQRNLMKKPINDNIAHDINKCMNLMVSDLISSDTLLQISKLISNIIQHKSYFNINTTILSSDSENKKISVIDLLDFNKLQRDFNFLLSITDKILFKSYTVKEFLESNSDFQALSNITTYNELLLMIEINFYSYKKKSKHYKKSESISENGSENENENESESISESERIFINATTVALRSFKQYASDFKYRELFMLCKQTFDAALNDIKHPIWDDCRHLFLNEQHFRNHINRLTTEDLDILFNNYWGMTLEAKISELELESQNKRMNWWWSLLGNVTKKSDVNEKKEQEKKDEFNADDLFNFFTENLERNDKWKKQWHNDLYYLNKPFKKDSKRITVEKMNKIYTQNRSWNDAGYIVEENEREKKKKKKLWNSLDWWRRT